MHRVWQDTTDKTLCSLNKRLGCLGCYFWLESAWNISFKTQECRRKTSRRILIVRGFIIIIILLFFSFSKCEFHRNYNKWNTFAIFAYNLWNKFKIGITFYEFVLKTISFLKIFHGSCIIEYHNIVSVNLYIRVGISVCQNDLQFLLLIYYIIDNSFTRLQDKNVKECWTLKAQLG